MTLFGKFPTDNHKKVCGLTGTSNAANVTTETNLIQFFLKTHVSLSSILRVSPTFFS